MLCLGNGIPFDSIFNVQCSDYTYFIIDNGFKIDYSCESNVDLLCNNVGLYFGASICFADK